MEDFRILSLKEEKELSTEELRKYYEVLREYLSTRKLTNTTAGALTIAPKLKKITNHLAKATTKILAGKDVNIISDGQENIPEGPVLYVHTHQGILDNFAWISETLDHCVIFHSAKVQKVLVWIQMNTGLVLVDKDSKENRKNAKLDTIQILQSGTSMSFFPESAWNLSPNKLHLPLNYNFLDIARKANVPVIPVVDEFTYDTSEPKEKIDLVHVRFGKPIYVGLEDDLEEKLEEYKEAISTMRWDLMAEKGLFERSKVSNIEYINFLKGNLKNLEFGKIDVNVERSNLWDVNNEFYKFHHINDVPFDEEGNLLETEEVRRLQRINRKHNI